MSYRHRPATRVLLSAAFAAPLVAVAGFTWSDHVNRAPVAREVSAVTLSNLPSPNAADTFVGADAELVRKDDIDKANTEGGHGFSAAEKAELVSANGRALGIVRVGLMQPFLNPPISSFDQPLPQLAKYRGLARLLSLEGQVRENRGDYAGAADSSLDAIALGVAVPNGGDLLHGLVGIACESIGEHALFRRVDHLTADQAAADARRLQALCDREVPVWVALTGEKLYGEAGLVNELRRSSNYDVYRKLNCLVSGDAAGAGDTQKLSERISTYFALQRVSKQDVVDNYSRGMNKIIAEAAQPYTPHHTVPAQSPDPLSSMLLPDPQVAEFKWRALALDTNLLTTSLALRAYRLRFGGYPSALEDVVRSKILGHLPADPFSAKGAALRYTRQANDKFLLYSVGADAVDNGGRAVAAHGGAGSKYHALDRTDTGDWVYGVNTPHG